MTYIAVGFVYICKISMKKVLDEDHRYHLIVGIDKKIYGFLKKMHLQNNLTTMFSFTVLL